MRITIQIEDGGAASVTTDEATRPSEAATLDAGGPTAPPEVQARAAALGANDGGAAPEAPGQAAPGTGPESRSAPGGYGRLPSPPFPAGGAGAPAAFTGEGIQETFGGGADLSAGAAPGGSPPVEERVEQAEEPEEEPQG